MTSFASPLPAAFALLVLAGCASHEAERAAAQRDAAKHAAAQQSAARQTATVKVDLPDVPAPTEQHAWLQQLVGEWTFTCTATTSEGDQPFPMKGTESVRSIGGMWIVAEGRATMAGQPVQSVMSLGYQPETQAFVGTWLDSMQTHLWSYAGTLDASKTRLTLDTEGPSFDDPTKMSKYRDAIELKDKDHKVLTSSVQGADGTWNTFMRAEYVRAH